jgi:Family of unknown function (DUF7009)
MKLGIKGNSLRLRVSRSEVAKVLQGERVEETIYFAPEATARLTYALEREPSVTMPTVRYTAAEVTVVIPADQALTWCLTDQVGIVENISLGSQGSLDVIVEKDFGCLDRSDEDNQDTFANPHAEATC